MLHYLVIPFASEKGNRVFSIAARYGSCLRRIAFSRCHAAFSRNAARVSRPFAGVRKHFAHDRLLTVL